MKNIFCSVSVFVGLISTVHSYAQTDKVLFSPASEIASNKIKTKTGFWINYSGESATDTVLFSMTKFDSLGYVILVRTDFNLDGSLYNEVAYVYSSNHMSCSITKYTNYGVVFMPRALPRYETQKNNFDCLGRLISIDGTMCNGKTLVEKYEYSKNLISSVVTVIDGKIDHKLIYAYSKE